MVVTAGHREKSHPRGEERMERRRRKLNWGKGLCWCSSLTFMLSCLQHDKVSLWNLSSPFFLPSAVSFSILSLVCISLSLSVLSLRPYGLFPHLSFELLTPQLRGVNGYCWVDTAQIRLHIAHISEVRPFKGITLPVPSAPSRAAHTQPRSRPCVWTCAVCYHEQLIVGQVVMSPCQHSFTVALQASCGEAAHSPWLTSPQAASLSSGYPVQWLTPVLINASADSDTSPEPCSCHVKEASTLRCSWQSIPTPSLRSRHVHTHTCMHTGVVKITGTADNTMQSSVIVLLAVKIDCQSLLRLLETCRIISHVCSCYFVPPSACVKYIQNSFFMLEFALILIIILAFKCGWIAPLSLSSWTVSCV